MFAKIKARLGKTRQQLFDGIADVFAGREIDEELLEEIESRLLMADVGIATTTEIIDELTDAVSRKALTDGRQLMDALEQLLASKMTALEQPLVIDRDAAPYVILMVGVNGAGKTTTIGKLSHWLQSQGMTIMLAAADTFRAAAVEQLKVWGERNNIDVVAQASGSDPASVAYDALQRAQSKKPDVLIIDTAGRLHTQDNLMNELAKIKRVLGKLDADAPHEVLLVIDGSTGQNAILQAKHFHEAVGVDGVVVTKLDGSAKGGALVSLADSLPVKLRFIGVGEGIDDLAIFSAADYAKAMIRE